MPGFDRLLHALVYGIHDKDHRPRGPFLRAMLPLGEARRPLTAGLLVGHPRAPDGPLADLLWEPVASRPAEALLGPVVLGLGLGRCRNGDLEPWPLGPTGLEYKRPRVRPVRVEGGGRKIRATGRPSGRRIAQGGSGRAAGYGGLG